MPRTKTDAGDRRVRQGHATDLQEQKVKHAGQTAAKRGGPSGVIPTSTQRTAQTQTVRPKSPRRVLSATLPPSKASSTPNKRMMSPKRVPARAAGLVSGNSSGTSLPAVVARPTKKSHAPPPDADEQDCSLLGRSACIHEEQGLRPTMEDATIVSRHKEWHLYGVFDGHGGSYVSAFLKKNMSRLPRVLCDNPPQTEKELATRIRMFFIVLDMELYGKKSTYRTGSTASVLLFNDLSQAAYIVNLGDSRTILFDVDNVLFESVDHKPDSERERKRFARISQGEPDAVRVIKGVARVRGSLAVSRAFGDWKYKISVEADDRLMESGWAADGGQGALSRTKRFEMPPYDSDPNHYPVSALPDVYAVNLQANSRNGKATYAILACDGLWDVMSAKAVASFIVDHIPDRIQNRIPNHTTKTESTTKTRSQRVALVDSVCDATGNGSSSKKVESRGVGICRKLVQTALHLGTTDNVTALIARLC